MIALVPLATVLPAQVEPLLDRAFGSDRHLRTAYRLRVGASPVAALSFAAQAANGDLLGTIQCWPVALACDDGRSVPMVMVGPVAVDPLHQQQGIGRLLMERMLDAVEGCEVEGCCTLMLIGDPEYYERFFGFSAEATTQWRLPGPFEQHRLLARGEDVPNCAGMVEQRWLRLGNASGFQSSPGGA